MKDNFIQLFSELELTSREAVYAFISRQLHPTENEKALLLKQALYQRESAGDIQIDTGVVLPHVESDLVPECMIAIIRPPAPISEWNETLKNIDLIIVVLLALETNDETKRRLVEFMRRLADPEFINKLRTINTID